MRRTFKIVGLGCATALGCGLFWLALVTLMNWRDPRVDVVEAEVGLSHPQQESLLEARDDAQAVRPSMELELHSSIVGASSGVASEVTGSTDFDHGAKGVGKISGSDLRMKAGGTTEGADLNGLGGAAGGGGGGGRGVPQAPGLLGPVPLSRGNFGGRFNGQFPSQALAQNPHHGRGDGRSRTMVDAAPRRSGAADPAHITGGYGGERYASIVENVFLDPSREEAALSTFSIDVDTASYSNVRRHLRTRMLPPPDAVRLEELVNYFSYDYAPPDNGAPFAARVETSKCPWNARHHLVRIGLKGRIIHHAERPASNLVFLIDVSGSMMEEDKLPLVKESLKLLVKELGEKDRISICVYAGDAKQFLPSTTSDHRNEILNAIESLQASGSTNGGAGIVQAYEEAQKHFVPKATNRVILCTDGDFNVGVTSREKLLELIAEKAKSKVFLSVLGFGTGNIQDHIMEGLADKGNGNYAYIDSLREGRKVLVEQMTGTLITIAKDVKIQVDFNPAHVAAYRLLGYENRMLEAADFKNDKKDAGEIGAGHSVTALYEIVPHGIAVPEESVEPSKYRPASARKPAAAPVPKAAKVEAAVADVPAKGDLSDELLTVRLRYKLPESDTSVPFEVPVKAVVQPFDATSADFQFAAAVVEFGMLLRNSQYCGEASFESVQEIAEGARGADLHGYRAEFIELVRTARQLARPQVSQR
jgi:secreted protein with Ig-like and vWFA domain